MLTQGLRRVLPLSARSVTVRIVDFKAKGDNYFSPILHVKVPKGSSLAELQSEVGKQKKVDADAISFSTLDGARISTQENLHHLIEMPFNMQFEDQVFTLNLNQRMPLEQDSLRSDMEPTEEQLEIYCRSIGIPKKQTDLLSGFIHKTYESLSANNLSARDLEQAVFNSLSYYRSFKTNRFGSNKSSEL